MPSRIPTRYGLRPRPPARSRTSGVCGGSSRPIDAGARSPQPSGRLSDLILRITSDSLRDRRHEDRRRLQLTLAASVALHATLLLGWKPAPKLWKPADTAVLTVLLRGPAPVPASQAAAKQEQTSAVLSQEAPAPAVFSVPVQAPQQRAVVPTAAPAQPALAPAAPAPVALQPTPGRVSNTVPVPVGVTVVLVVGEEGRVEQIFWNQLPALTNEQLRRVEALIRQKTYRPSQTVNEVVDVRGLLMLAPAHPAEDPNLAPAASGGQLLPERE